MKGKEFKLLYGTKYIPTKEEVEESEKLRDDRAKLEINILVYEKAIEELKALSPDIVSKLKDDIKEFEKKLEDVTYKQMYLGLTYYPQDRPVTNDTNNGIDQE